MSKVDESGVPSPCIDVCTLDARMGWCAGCMRTIEEIAAWSALDDAAKRDVIGRLAARREILERSPDAKR